MRLFWTLSAVPRPDASFFGLMGITLATYLAFQQVPVEVFGRELSALQLALSVFYTTSISRNLILNGRIWRGRTGKVGGILALLGIPLAVFWITSAAEPITLQIAFSAYMLAYAAMILGLLKWDPEGIGSVPSIWARDPRFAAPALTLVCLGDAAFATTLAGLAFLATELTWVVAMTLGAIGSKFFVNWIIVLLIVAKLDEED